MTKEKLPVNEQLIASLENQFAMQRVAMQNLKNQLGAQFDEAKAQRIEIATRDTILVLKGEAATHCSDLEILFNTDMMLFRAKAIRQELTEKIYSAVRAELKNIFITI